MNKKQVKNRQNSPENHQLLKIFIKEYLYSSHIYIY